MAASGRKVKFHGAFKSKRAARQKESSREGSFILKRRIRGKVRYLVVTER
jgi:hypothetical protein